MKEKPGKTSDYFKNAEQGSPLVEKILEKKRIEQDIDSLQDSFETLVRNKINLDAPQRKLAKELSESKRMLEELKLRQSSKEIGDLEETIRSIEEQLAETQVGDLIADSELDPADQHRSSLIKMKNEKQAEIDSMMDVLKN